MCCELRSGTPQQISAWLRKEHPEGPTLVGVARIDLSGDLRASQTDAA